LRRFTDIAVIVVGTSILLHPAYGQA